MITQSSSTPKKKNKKLQYIDNKNYINDAIEDYTSNVYVISTKMLTRLNKIF